MSIVRFNPAREMDEFFNRFADLPRNFWGEQISSSDWTPAVDIRETDEGYLIDIDLPAVAADDVNVNVKDGLLGSNGRAQIRKGNRR